MIAALPDGYDTIGERATASPAARSSGSRSRGRFCATRRSSSSTRPRARSTPRPSVWSRRHSTACRRGRTTRHRAPPRRCVTPSRSSCSTGRIAESGPRGTDRHRRTLFRARQPGRGAGNEGACPLDLPAPLCGWLRATTAASARRAVDRPVLHRARGRGARFWGTSSPGRSRPSVPSRTHSPRGGVRPDRRRVRRSRGVDTGQNTGNVAQPDHLRDLHEGYLCWI